MKKILLLFLFLPFTFFGQLSLTNDSPRDLQLVARDPDDSDRGIIPIEGSYDKTGGAPDYTSIRVKVYRDGESSTYDLGTEVISYNGDVGTFDFGNSIKIMSEKKDYLIEIYGVTGNTESNEPIHTAVNVVAGDVYIIQGQSNAVAKSQPDGGSSSSQESPYIRVYGSGCNEFDRLDGQDSWYQGVGDATRCQKGNVGQWGITLARMLLGNDPDVGYPIAIFNGARGGKAIGYFDEVDGPLEGINGEPATLPNGKKNNNFWRLQYRLEKTGLTDNVKAVFWSQGEQSGRIESVEDYTIPFTKIKDSWLNSYRFIEQFYIFQTINGCESDFEGLQYTKEAQRQLADEDNVHIMNTDGLKQFNEGDPYYFCHFEYVGGYDGFASRIYNLVDRDFYSGPSDNINAPNIIGANLVNYTTLEVETSSTKLKKDTHADTFQLEDANGKIITGISVSGSKITFTLSGYPGLGASISNIGADPGVTDRFVRDSTNGIEILSFYKYPIKEMFNPIWNGSSWSPIEPNSTTDAIIAGYYDADDGGFTARNLIINSGVDVDLDNGTTNSVVLYGDLTINGTFVIGDKESLVMYKDDPVISGEITKLERSSPRQNVHDVTYWAATVENAKVEDAFPEVDPNRIFYYDQSKSSEIVEGVGDYWEVWVNAPQNEPMIPGLGFAAEGVGPGIHDISFTGKPNNGTIYVPVGYQDSGNNFYLIGNPYPSAIDMAEFFSANSNIDGAAYLWTHNTGVSSGGDFVVADYAIVNSSGGVGSDSGSPVPTTNIGSSQGFFVRATTSGDVEFNNSMRIEEANDQFFKVSTQKKGEAKIEKSMGGVTDRIWLNLTTDEGGFSQILLGYKKGLSNKVDHGYDALIFSGSNNPISFYSVIEREKYAIQSQRTFVKQRKARLGFDTTVAPRMFNISIAKTEGTLKGIDVFLEDRHLKKTHNLSKSDYSFLQLTTGEFKSRFILRYSETRQSEENTPPVNDDKEFKVYDGPQGMVVESNNIIRKFRVFNLYGRRYRTVFPKASSFVVDGLKWIKPGSLLIVEATFMDGEIKTKKIIKN